MNKSTALLYSIHSSSLHLGAFGSVTLTPSPFWQSLIFLIRNCTVLVGTIVNVVKNIGDAAVSESAPETVDNSVYSTADVRRLFFHCQTNGNIQPLKSIFSWSIFVSSYNLNICTSGHCNSYEVSWKELCHLVLIKGKVFFLERTAQCRYALIVHLLLETLFFTCVELNTFL